jgi:hypothetical protein
MGKRKRGYSMNENRTLLCYLSLLAVLLLGFSSQVYAQQTQTYQAVVNAHVAPMVLINQPDNVVIPYERPGKTASATYTIGVASNTNWKLSVRGSNGGYMTSVVDPSTTLRNPLAIQYTGKPKGKTITLTGSDQLYCSGTPGLNELPTTFYQGFVGKDAKGSYTIDIYWLLEPNF